MNLLYFAYGSNMLTGRLRTQVPSARPLGPGRLSGRRLVFHKRGTDGSAKADCLQTGEPDDVLHGVLFEIAATDRPALDRADGLGQGCLDRRAQVLLEDGRQVEAFTDEVQPEYYARELRPFSWYLAYVVEGAEEHGLPETHVARLRAVQTCEDPDPARGTGATGGGPSPAVGAEPAQRSGRWLHPSSTRSPPADPWLIAPASSMAAL